MGVKLAARCERSNTNEPRGYDCHLRIRYLPRPESLMPRLTARVLPLFAAALALSIPSLLTAQACLGNPSFATNHLQFGAGADATKEATTFGADFTAGSESVFGTVGVGGATFDGVDGSSVLARAAIGFQVPLSVATAQICPVVSAQYGFGPNDFDGLGTDFSSRGFGFGISIGGEVVKTQTVTLVPALSFGFVYAAGIYDGLLGQTKSTDTYATAGLALGLVVSDKLSVRPSVSFPIGLEGSEPVYGIGFALNYGGRR